MFDNNFRNFFFQVINTNISIQWYIVANVFTICVWTRIIAFAIIYQMIKQSLSSRDDQIYFIHFCKSQLHEITIYPRCNPN